MRLPTYQISRAYYTKGIAAAIGLGLAGLVLLTLLFALVPFLGFFFFIVMGGLGYAIGEGVGKAELRLTPSSLSRMSRIKLARKRDGRAFPTPHAHSPDIRPRHPRQRGVGQA